jgi:hypothetical protein
VEGEKDQAVPWYPHPDLPQCPCGVTVEAIPGGATVRVVYSIYEGDEDLIIELITPVAVLFEEFSSPKVEFPPNYPRLSSERWHRRPWPIMTVRNSSWLAENIHRLLPDHAYEHVRIISDDGSFDAIIEYEPSNVVLVLGRGKVFYKPTYRREPPIAGD